MFKYEPPVYQNRHGYKVTATHKYCQACIDSLNTLLGNVSKYSPEYPPILYGTSSTTCTLCEGPLTAKLEVTKS